MNKGLIGRLLPIGLLAFYAACADSTEGPEDLETTHPVATRGQEIKGGYEDTQSNFAVGIYAAQGYSGGICSGTLIAPNLVLTAQHCVAQVTSQYVVCGESGFGSKLNPQNLLVTTAPQLSRRAYFFRGQEVHTPPGGNDMCGFDMALIVLDESVPGDVAIPVIPRIDIAPWTGERYSAIGYGHTGEGYGSGIRRRIDNRTVNCSGNCPPYTSVQSTEFLGTEGTCQGDSGGTALDAQGRVIGALSRGPDGCMASVYSAVYGWGDWMREIGARAAELGGYEPSFWVTYGVSEIPEDDTDLDGVLIDNDNCPDIANEDQNDLDEDGLGDACDSDVDGDEIDDENDNCAMDANADQADLDGDGKGDICDADDDGDGVDDADDNCPEVANKDQADTKNNGIGDACRPPAPERSNTSANCSAAGTPADGGTIALLLIGLFGWRRRS